MSFWSRLHNVSGVEVHQILRGNTPIAIALDAQYADMIVAALNVAQRVEVEGGTGKDFLGRVFAEMADVPLKA